MNLDPASMNFVDVAARGQRLYDRYASTKPGPNDPPPFHEDDGKQPLPEPKPKQEPKPSGE